MKDDWFDLNYSLFEDYKAKVTIAQYQATLSKPNRREINYFLILGIDCIPLYDLRWYWMNKIK